jgi:hypothetical protein
LVGTGSYGTGTGIKLMHKTITNTKTGRIEANAPNSTKCVKSRGNLNSVKLRHTSLLNAKTVTTSLYRKITEINIEKKVLKKPPSKR